MRRSLSRSSFSGHGRRRFTQRAALCALLVLLCAAMAHMLQRAAAEPKPEQEVVPVARATPRPVSDGNMPSAEIDYAPAYASAHFGFQTAVIQSDAIVERYTRTPAVRFGHGAAYTTVQGVTTYAGDPYRNSFTYGTRDIRTRQLARVWEFETGVLQTDSGDSWQGTGWTGMPLIVKWDETVRSVLGIRDEYKAQADFTEVIYPATDGKIYFFELYSGAQTRTPIELGVVMKGTATLDPRGYPVLYVGQGVEGGPDGNGAWVRAVSLIENRVIWRFGGRDEASLRAYQAYDGSALIDGATDTLFVPGENGILYSTRLHTRFDVQTGALSIQPEPLVKYRYTANGYGEEADASSPESRAWGIESSLSAYGEYGFLQDNGGFLQCIDLNTLMLCYAVDLQEESDATLVIEEGDDTFYLYSATMAGGPDGESFCYHRKLDGRTGEILWENAVPVRVTGSAVSGTISTPHAGHGSIEDLLIVNSTMTPLDSDGAAYGGSLMAYEKSTGKTVWRHTQTGGYWSSPVVLYDTAQKAYVLQCDRVGMMALYDAKSGETLFTLNLGSRIESTPAVFDDMIVVGTRGKYGSGEAPKIIGVKIG